MFFLHSKGLNLSFLQNTIAVIEKRKEKKSITYISLLSRPWNVLIFVLSIRQFVVSFFLTIRLSDDLRCFWRYTRKAGIIGLNRRITPNLFTLNKNDLHCIPTRSSENAAWVFCNCSIIIWSYKGAGVFPKGSQTSTCRARDCVLPVPSPETSPSWLKWNKKY